MGAREESAEERKQKEELPQEFINIFSGEVIMPKPEINMFTGEPIQEARESDLVREARQSRWSHIVGEEEPTSTDADMTPEEIAERERVGETVKNIGNGTYTAPEQDAKDRYDAVREKAREDAEKAKKESGGGLFNMSFVNSVENPAGDGSNSQNKNNAPEEPEPVFFNKSEEEVINKIQEHRSKNNNSPQAEVSVAADNFTNMEELD